MKSYNDTVKRDAERAMKRLPQYRENRDEQTALNYELAFVLAHAARATDVVAVAKWENQYISFQPYADEPAKELRAFDCDGICWMNLQKDTALLTCTRQSMRMCGHSLPTTRNTIFLYRMVLIGILAIASTMA